MLRVQDAPQTIKPRIELENRQREDMRRAQAAEILGIFVSYVICANIGEGGLTFIAKHTKPIYWC